jgi:hypothetical protein
LIEHLRARQGLGAAPKAQNLRLNLLSKKKIVWTQEGHIGWTSISSQKGDMVCAILGSHVLILLRPSPMDANIFKVVGDAYLPAFATGEALLGPMPETCRLCFSKDASGVEQPFFFDPIGKYRVLEDLRLGDLPDAWQRVNKKRSQIDPVSLNASRTIRRAR